MTTNTKLPVAGCVLLLISGCSQDTETDSQTTRANANASEEIASLHATLDERDGELKAHSRGMSLLLAMSHEPDGFRTLIEFLATIRAGQVRCEIRELEYYALVHYIYRTSYYLPGGSYRPTLNRKSALVLFDAKTRHVIDFTFESGYRSDVISSQEPHYERSWDRKDGTSVRYRLMPSGFETSKLEEQGQ